MQHNMHVVQDGEPQVERQSGQCDSGKRIQVYNADMRCRIALQFWPDDYEWSEKVSAPCSPRSASTIFPLSNHVHMD